MIFAGVEEKLASALGEQESQVVDGWLLRRPTPGTLMFLLCADDTVRRFRKKRNTALAADVLAGPTALNYAAPHGAY